MLSGGAYTLHLKGFRAFTDLAKKRLWRGQPTREDHADVGWTASQTSEETEFTGVGAHSFPTCLSGQRDGTAAL